MTSSSIGATLIVISFVLFTIFMFLWHCHLKRMHRKLLKRKSEAADDLENPNRADEDDDSDSYVLEGRIVTIYRK